jgi:NAD(P)-dependent dehydrogenase (short-subunit alcohol dehydrogenase family)
VPCSPRSTSGRACSTTRRRGRVSNGLGPAHALGRIGTVTEIAEAIEYLARAEWTTGAVLTVDGGLSLGVTNA